MTDRLTAAEAPMTRERWLQMTAGVFVDDQAHAIYDLFEQAFPTAKIVVPEVEEKVVWEFTRKVTERDREPWISVIDTRLTPMLGQDIVVAIIPSGQPTYGELKRRLREWEKYREWISPLGSTAIGVKTALAAMPKEQP